MCLTIPLLFSVHTLDNKELAGPLIPGTSDEDSGSESFDEEPLLSPKKPKAVAAIKKNKAATKKPAIDVGPAPKRFKRFVVSYVLTMLFHNNDTTYSSHPSAIFCSELMHLLLPYHSSFIFFSMEKHKELKETMNIAGEGAVRVSIPLCSQI
jgi:hypothetical protein